jgi:hypothetical protein
MKLPLCNESDCSGDKHQSLPKRESMYKAMKFQKETYQDVVSFCFSSEGQEIYQPLIISLIDYSCDVDPCSWDIDPLAGLTSFWLCQKGIS